MGGSVLPTRQAGETLTKSTSLPKGGTRFVRVRFKLSRGAPHALPAAQSTVLVESGRGQSGEKSPIYHPTALWQQWIQARSCSGDRCRHATHRRVGNV